MTEPKLRESVPLTPELQETILRFLEQWDIQGDVNFYTTSMEILRIDIANALLRAMGLMEVRVPIAADAEVQELPRVARPRRTIAFIVRARIAARDGFKCVKCQSVLGLEIDHIVPLALGGADDETNLQTLCGRCNRQKGARLEDE